MLVLTRRHRESIVVGDAKSLDHLLKLTILEIRGGKVKLGIEAGDDVPVHRWETWLRMRHQDVPRTANSARDAIEISGLPQQV